MCDESCDEIDENRVHIKLLEQRIDKLEEALTLTIKAVEKKDDSVLSQASLLIIK